MYGKINHLLRNARSTTRTVWQVRLGEYGQDGYGDRRDCKLRRVSSILTLPSLKVRPSTKCITPTDGHREGATD